jgi:RsiW-degrading membrane proteinase PrsW (M82 family)
MDTLLLLKALIALAPVVLLLFVFDRLDAFDLINLRDILLLLGAGGVIAALCFFTNWRVLDGFPIGISNYSRYVAPVIEESLKAAPIVLLFGANRLGFKLDAAIAGFALGAGFSMIENVWYLYMIAEANVTGWLVRGFGTAIMHGGTAALFAIASHEMTERQAEGAAAKYRFNVLLFVPGLLLAILLHGLFNALAGAPLVAMAATLLLAPATIFFALARNERATRHWLASDRAAHAQMLAEIRNGGFSETASARAMKDAASRLGSKSTEDVLAYAELKTELVLRAEELILASQSGEAAKIGAEDRAKFAQLRALEGRLGKTVAAAISSQLGFTRNDIWELGRLKARAEAASDQPA